MDNITVTDTGNSTVIFDSEWPQLKVDSLDEAMMVSQDQWDYDLDNITAAEFIEMWGINPATDYIIAYTF